MGGAAKRAEDKGKPDETPGDQVCVTSVQEIPTMLEAELRPIMSSLQPFLIPNWDEEGASGIGLATLLSLVAVLSELPNDMPRPVVTPNYDGSVGLFWDDTSAYVHVVLGPRPGETRLLYRLPSGINERSDLKSGSVASEILAALQPAIAALRPDRGLTFSYSMSGVVTGSISVRANDLSLSTV